MKRIILLSFTLLLIGQLSAQNVGIGTDTPHASAKLDISSNNMGILIPQVDLNTVSFPSPGPATGLLVWNTNVAFGNGIGFYYNFGTSAAPAWLKIADTGSVADADADPSNELQDLSSSTSGTNRTINITGGTGTTINVADNDNNSSNELQTISKSGSTVTLSGGGGSFTDDNTTYDGSDFALSGQSAPAGNYVTGVDAGGALTWAPDDDTDADADPNNELQDLSSSSAGTNRTINITSGTGTTFNVADNDNSSSNELQTVSISGSTISLSNGGGSVTVPSSADNLGNHTATTNLNMSSNFINNVSFVSPLANNTYVKYRLWSNDSYAIGLNNAMTFGFLNDQAMTFTMPATTTRGWIWRDAADAKSDGAMSLTTDGRLTLKGTARLQSLVGAGTRMVTANVNGDLSTQAIPVNTDNQDLSSSVSGTNRTINITGGTGTTINVADNDNSSSNELQTVSISGSTISLSNGGGSVTVPSSADNLGNHTATTNLNMSSNFINNVDFVGTIGTPTYDKYRVWSNSSYAIGMNSSMTFGFLNDYAMTFTMNQDNDRGWIWRDVSDAKSDGAMSLTTDGRLTLKATARLQSLAGTGTRMVTANANGDLSTQAIPVNTDNQDLSSSVSGTNRTINITGGTGTTINVADNDNSSSNELQNLSISGSTVTLSGGGGSVTIPSSADNLGNHNATTRLFMGSNDIIINNGRFIENQDGDQNIQIADDNPTWEGDVYGGVTRFYGDGNAATNKLEAGGLELYRNLRVGGLSGTGVRMVVADAEGDLSTQAIPANGDITGVNAGDGLVGGGSAGTVTLNVVATNGLTDNANDIRLGGTLVQNTTINQSTFGMNFNLNSSGDFNLQDNGTTITQFRDDGVLFHGDDMYWRDGSFSGTNLMILTDDGNDGRLRIYENGVTSVDLDANTQFVFNEQGFNRDFRVESDGNANMFRVDASANAVGIGDGAPLATLNVVGQVRASNEDTETNYIEMDHNGSDAILNVVGTGNLDFTTAGTIRATLEAGSGELGVNAPTPGALLHLRAYNTGISSGIRLESSAGNGQDWYTYMNSNDNMIIRDDASDVICFENGSDEVGFETNAPTANISVNGPANKTGGGTWAVFSDARLKQDVNPYSEGLDLILKVKPVSFRYNQTMRKYHGPGTDTEKVYQGVIAQDLQEIAPDMVREVDFKGSYIEGEGDNQKEIVNESAMFLEVDPNKFTYALINAVQEQQAQIATLQNQIDELKDLLENK